MPFQRGKKNKKYRAVQGAINKLLTLSVSTPHDLAKTTNLSICNNITKHNYNLRFYQPLEDSASYYLSYQPGYWNHKETTCKPFFKGIETFQVN